MSERREWEMEMRYIVKHSSDIKQLGGMTETYTSNFLEFQNIKCIKNVSINQQIC